jgi:hypothetical protein
MKTLKESLLADIDDTINKGEDDIYNIPSIDDFKKDPYNSRNFFVPWWIPHIMQKYRSKYPEILTPGFDGIGFYIDKGWKKLKIYFINNTNYRKSLRVILTSWTDTPITGKIDNNKKEVIEMITKLAKEPKYLDRFFKQEYEDYESRELYRTKYMKKDELKLNDISDEDYEKLYPFHDRNLKNLLK